MTVFAIGVALLLALTGWMLSPALRPRLEQAPHARQRAHWQDAFEALERDRRAGLLDPAQHELARQELERRVLAESTESAGWRTPANPRRLALVLALALPLASIGLYARLGDPDALATSPASPEADGANPDQAVEAMLATLAQRLQTPSGDPAHDAQGWTMLARSYAALLRFKEADQAFARALSLSPHDAQLLVDRADVLAMLQDRRLAGEPERLIADALRADPGNLKALALAGNAAFERLDKDAARGYWQRARALAPAGGEFAAELDRDLAELGATQGPVPGAEGLPAARVSGRVSLAPALAARAAPTDTVFVFARPVGGGMPLAMLRRTVADLPFEFSLDDSLAMSPRATLSGSARVVVGARISRAGQAAAQPGDLAGDSGEIGNRTEGLQLSIDRVQP